MNNLRWPYHSIYLLLSVGPYGRPQSYALLRSFYTGFHVFLSLLSIADKVTTSMRLTHSLDNTSGIAGWIFLPEICYSKKSSPSRNSFHLDTLPLGVLLMCVKIL